jgi:hypothetical protein
MLNLYVMRLRLNVYKNLLIASVEPVRETLAHNKALPKAAWTDFEDIKASTEAYDLLKTMRTDPLRGELKDDQILGGKVRILNPSLTFLHPDFDIEKVKITSRNQINNMPDAIKLIDFLTR